MNSSDILPNTSALCSLIPAAISAYGFIKGKYKGEWLPYYFLICIIAENNYFLLRNPLISSWIIVALVLAQLFLFTAHFQKILSFKNRKWLVAVGIVICLWLLFTDIKSNLHRPYFFPSNSIMATSVLIAVYCLSHYIQIFKNPTEESLFDQPNFIFSTGALLFFGASVFTNYYHDSSVIEHHVWLDELLWQIHAVLLILFYALSSIYLWKIKSMNLQ